MTEFVKFVYDFQTLLTGLAALIAAYLALWPILRQTAMMSEQLGDLKRSRIVEYHQVLSQAISVLELLKWPEALPRERYVADEAACLDGYKQRKAAVASLISDLRAIPLRPAERKVVDDGLSALEGVYEQYDGWLARTYKTEASLGNPPRDTPRDFTELWFFQIDQPDSVAKRQARDIRIALDATRTKLVAQLA